MTTRWATVVRGALPVAAAFALCFSPNAIQAKPAFSAIAVDAYTGKVVYERAPDEPRFPASLTKMMTLYLVFQDLQAGRITKDTRFTMSARAASRPPSKLGLKPGQTIRVEDAILALVTRSANDVASAIGENLAGSESAFAERMTRTARSIGMSRTTYRNASGLPDPGQRTTARDMATLGLRLQRDFPRQFTYFSRGSFTYGGRVVRNHNRLLGRLRGVDGIKTGYTRASGFNLVTSAGRDGRRVVGVVMGGVSGGARNRYMAAMVETAFPKVSKGSVIALAAGRVTGASAVAAAGPQAEPAKVRMASVPVPRPKPEVAEPDMALVPVSVAADLGDDEEAQAQEASVSANDPVLRADSHGRWSGGSWLTARTRTLPTMPRPMTSSPPSCRVHRRADGRASPMMSRCPSTPMHRRSRWAKPTVSSWRARPRPPRSSNR